jgi:hypothetical protein
MAIKRLLQSAVNGLTLVAWLVLCSGVAVAQAQGDVCHVYVVDREKALKANEKYRDTGDPEKDARAMLAAQTVFPEFRTTVGEEELTVKSYPFPGSKLFITASVFYTDESMASQRSGADSMIVAVAVANKPLKDAFAAAVEKSAAAEVTYDEHTDTVRAKQYVTVRSRSYLVGIECHVKPKT